MLAFGSMHTVDFIVSRHDRTWLSHFDGNHEWEKIYLSQRSLGDYGTDCHPLVFLVIADEMLKSGNNSFLLNTLTVVTRQNTREKRILGVRFEAPSA